MQNLLQRHQQRLASVSAHLNSVSPLGTLQRGYAIVTDATHGTIIHQSSQLQPGQHVKTQLGKGEFISTVTVIDPKPA